MADRGRDLEFAIVSDVDRFDVDKPADALDRLGDTAKTTARTVDDALDKIGDASRSKLGKVDDDARRAGDGLGEFKDEANSTSREAAASFGGVEDALDAVQEIAANAFAGFGPAGAAAGLLAAGGIGLVFSGLQSAADKANEAKDRIIGMAQAITDAGGAMEDVDFVGMMRDWSFAIGDNKSWWELWQKDNTTNLEIVKRKADAAGVSFKDLFRGMQGDDPAAAKRALDEINRALDDNQAAHQRAASSARDNVTAAQRSIANLSNERDAILAAKAALLERTGETEEAIRTAALYASTQAAAAKADQEREATIKATTDAVTAIGQAEVTRADGTVKSIEQVIKAQEKEIRAKRDFLKNTTEVLSEVGQAGVDWANSFGPLAPQMMQLLAKAPKDKQAEIIANYAEAGALAGQSTAAGMTTQADTVATAAARLHKVAAAEIARLGAIGITLGVDGDEIPASAKLALANIQAYYDKHPLRIPIKSGSRTGRDVI